MGFSPWNTSDSIHSLSAVSFCFEFAKQHHDTYQVAASAATARLYIEDGALAPGSPESDLIDFDPRLAFAFLTPFLPNFYKTPSANIIYSAALMIHDSRLMTGSQLTPLFCNS